MMQFSLMLSLYKRIIEQFYQYKSLLRSNNIYLAVHRNQDSSLLRKRQTDRQTDREKEIVCGGTDCLWVSNN